MSSILTPTSTEAQPSDRPREFLNRELTWLVFNQRVLHEAMDERTPLLERLRFLGIFTSNLDEFFMKRVGGLKRQVWAGVVSLSIDGMTPSQQLAAIRSTVIPMLQEQARTFTEDILPALAEQGIHVLEWDQLTDAEKEWGKAYFNENIFPVLTPFAVDPGHPFPFLSNLSLSLGVTLRHEGKEERLFARIKVPDVLPRWVRSETDEFPDEFRFVNIVDIIRHNLDELFEGLEVLSVTPFRVTRNADVERDEEDAEDLLDLIEQELRERRFARCVRLEHEPNADPWTVQFLMQALDVTEQDVYELPAELDYTGLKPVIDLELPHLKYPSWTPVVPAPLQDVEADIFRVIRSRDLLVHHPYESFSASVERMIRDAAEDPNVLAIKLTLYRIGESHSFMNSLIRAAENGKQVVCLVELKARFDEQRNIQWAQELERAGVHVVYGIVGLKTHTKLTLVVRRESRGLRCYAHVGTGNYNVTTARLYTDLGMLTARKEITDEAIELFHYLTGRSLKEDYDRLLVAPSTMRKRFMDLIEREVENQEAGKPAHIVAKINSLEDRKIIRALYRASGAGVPIDLIVRGFCCLRPGVPGMSENIRVISIIGRFLEHARIFHFRDGREDPVEGKFFIGSADWMYRNLNHRVEVVTPVEHLHCRQRLWEILDVQLNDQRQAWDMKPDGDYVQRQPTDPQTQIGTHLTLMARALDRSNISRQGHVV